MADALRVLPCGHGSTRMVRKSSKKSSKSTPPPNMRKLGYDEAMKGQQTQKNSDLSKILTSKHEKKWVALSRDRKKVISFDESLVRLRESVKGADVLYMKVPSTEGFLSF